MARTDGNYCLPRESCSGLGWPVRRGQRELSAISEEHCAQQAEWIRRLMYVCYEEARLAKGDDLWWCAGCTGAGHVTVPATRPPKPNNTNATPSSLIMPTMKLFPSSKTVCYVRFLVFGPSEPWPDQVASQSLHGESSAGPSWAPLPPYRTWRREQSQNCVFKRVRSPSCIANRCDGCKPGSRGLNGQACILAVCINNPGESHTDVTGARGSCPQCYRSCMPCAFYLEQPTY